MATMKPSDNICAFIGRDYNTGHLFPPRWWIRVFTRADMAPRAWEPVPCN